MRSGGGDDDDDDDGDDGDCDTARAHGATHQKASACLQTRRGSQSAARSRIASAANWRLASLLFSLFSVYSGCAAFRHHSRRRRQQ